MSILKKFEAMDNPGKAVFVEAGQYFIADRTGKLHALLETSGMWMIFDEQNKSVVGVCATKARAVQLFKESFVS